MNESTDNVSQKDVEKTPFQKDMERAAFSAAKYFTEMMQATNTVVSNLRLEEIEQKSDGNKKFWSVTISFFDDGNGTIQMLYGNRTRVYKVVTVTDGDFVATSIKNRD